MGDGESGAGDSAVGNGGGENGIAERRVVDSSLIARWAALDVYGLSDQGTICAVADVVQAENVLAGLKARLLARIDATGLAAELGATSAAAWLTGSGRVDPGAAKRQVGVARSLSGLPQMADLLHAGEISAAHAEAIVAATVAIDNVCPDLPDEGREAVEVTLATVALTETPARVREKGRQLLLALQPDGETPPDDPDRNRLDYTIGRDGRGHIRGDVDRLTLEKLRSAVEPLSAPRPGPDGELDPRSASQRRADGFADVLDKYLGGSGPGGNGRSQVTLIAEAKDLAGNGRFACTDTGDGGADDGESTGETSYYELFDAPWPFHLSWTGSVSRQVAQMLACDCDVTVVVVDGNRVPLDVGRTERLVTKDIRTALIVRDEGCAVPGCGRPPSWCDAHHIRDWIKGGETCLANMVLLCRHHHRMIHRGLWRVFMGDDGHPWFIPPATVDPERKPMPAHNRRGAG